MKNCELGCSHYTCGSIGHIKECVNYPESLSELFDNAKARNEELESLLREISSRTAVKSILIDGGEEDQKIAVLIEDVQDLLNKADQI